MTATISSRPRLGRAAMILASAAAVLLIAAPKAGAWSATTGDFKIDKPYSSYSSTEVTVKEYTGSDTEITLPSTVTYNGQEYTVTAVGSNVLKKLAGVDDIDITVTIPEGYTTLEGNAFRNCYGLKSITIPSTVTGIRYNAFDGCKNLTAVTFADSTNSLSFGNQIFNNCTSLNNLVLPARSSSIGAGIFQGCTSLTDLSATGDAYFAQDGVLYQKNSDGNGYTLHSYAPGLTATNFAIPSEVNGKPVTSIFRMAFQNNNTLQSVTIPASVTDFQMYCFENCTALKKISIAAENVTLANSSFTNLPEGSVIEVANDTVKNAFEPSRTSYGSLETHYTAGKTTVQVKGGAPEPEATPAATLTVKGTGVKDGYSYYKLTLDNAANVSTMKVNLSFDATQVSKDAQTEGKKGAYIELNDTRFMIPTQTWKEESGKVKVSILLIPADNKAVTSADASNLLLLALPVKANVTGNLTATVDSAECAGVVSNVPKDGTVNVNGSPASNRATSYDVYADGKIDILDITEAQRFYQMTNSDEDWKTAQKADVNADNQVDIQDLIDIFLQIKF